MSVSSLQNIIYKYVRQHQIDVTSLPKSVQKEITYIKGDDISYPDWPHEHNDLLRTVLKELIEVGIPQHSNPYFGRYIENDNIYDVELGERIKITAYGDSWVNTYALDSDEKEIIYVSTNEKKLTIERYKNDVLKHSRKIIYSSDRHHYYIRNIICYTPDGNLRYEANCKHLRYYENGVQIYDEYYGSDSGTAIYKNGRRKSICKNEDWVYHVLHTGHEEGIIEDYDL